MLRMSSSVWLAVAAAACSVDSRNPGIESIRGQNGAPAETGTGAQPGVANLQQNPAAGTPPTSSGGAASGAASPGGQDGRGSGPAALGSTPAGGAANPASTPL